MVFRAVNYFHKEAQSYIVGNKAKEKSQNGCNKKTKHVKFSEKQTFPTPSEIKNVRFSENLPFCFLVTPVLRLFFCLITDVHVDFKYSSEF